MKVSWDKAESDLQGMDSAVVDQLKENAKWSCTVFRLRITPPTKAPTVQSCGIAPTRMADPRPRQRPHEYFLLYTQTDSEQEFEILASETFTRSRADAPGWIRGSMGSRHRFDPAERAVPSALHPGQAARLHMLACRQHERYRPCDAALRSPAISSLASSSPRRALAAVRPPRAVLAIVLYALFGILDLYIVPSAPSAYADPYAFFCPVALSSSAHVHAMFKPIMQPVLTGIAI